MTAHRRRLPAKAAGLAPLVPRAARVASTHAQQTTSTNSPSSYREDEIIFNPVAEVCTRHFFCSARTQLTYWVQL